MANAPVHAPRKSDAPTGRPRALIRFGRDAKGATAVEFGLLALPFMALVGALLETAMAFWAQGNLEKAVYEGARDIYTGNFQTANAANKNKTQLLSALRTRICTENSKARETLFDCSNVRLNVGVADDFAKLAPVPATQTDPQTGVASWNPAFGTNYSCATSSSAVLVQAAVDYPVFFSLLNPTAVTLPGSKRVLQAAAVFRVEPYDSRTACS